MNRCLEDTLAKFTIVETGQGSLLRGVHDDDSIRSLTTTTLCILLTLSDIRVRHASQVFLLVDPHNGVVGSSLKQIAPLLLQFTDAQVNLLHAGHLIV